MDEINLSVDDFKDGFYNQCKSFLNNEFKDFCSLEQQLENFKWYYKISNYKET